MLISVTPLDCVLCNCSVMSCSTFVLMEDNYLLDKRDVIHFNVLYKGSILLGHKLKLSKIYDLYVRFCSLG